MVTILGLLSPLMNCLTAVQFIFLLLLSTIISGCFSWTAPTYSVSGSVESGRYLYYTIEVSGPPKSLRIQLLSHKGDADLYVASKGMGQASYSNYIAKSDSCGLDLVELGKYFPRPFSVGIYGHPTHTTSNFTLMVFSVNLPDDEYEMIEKGYYSKLGKSYEELTRDFQTYDPSDQSMNEDPNTRDAKTKQSHRGSSGRAQSKSRNTNSNDEDMPSSFLGTLLLHLLEIIFDILL